MSAQPIHVDPPETRPVLSVVPEPPARPAASSGVGRYLAPSRRGAY